MEECKTIFPRYIATLKKNNIPDQELKLTKKVIILFIKEYIKHNNNKFNRTRFNVDFVNTFIQKLVPTHWPELSGLSFLKTQSIITNFINYLSLQDILQKSIAKEILKTYTINSTPSSNKMKETKKIIQKDTDQIPFSEIPYSEKKWDKLMNL
jgi:hypothetical protein